MKIGIDLDDVIVDFIGGLINYFNKKYHTNILREDIPNWNFFSTELYEEFKLSGGYRKLKLIPGAKEFFFWLKSIGEVSIITIRSEEYKQDTHALLEETIKELYEPGEVYLTNAKPKLDLCRKLDIHLLIDDSIIQTREVAEKLGIFAILYNNGTQMFGNAKKHPWVYQARNMDEVKKYVLEIKSILSK